MLPRSMATRPDRAYLVCATPRSGSTLLCRSLAATGVAGRPEEYFERLRHSGLPREPREYFADVEDPEILGLLPPTRAGDPAAADLERELPRFLAEGTTPNGVFGAKMMWGYLDDALRRLGSSAVAPDAPAALEAALGPLRYVYVSRRDKVDQAVSLWRAVQTRAWSAQDGPEAHPVYDARGVAHLEAQLREEDAAWADWFAAHGIEPFRVCYEDFVATYEATLRGALDFLGIGAAEIPPPPLERQADERSERWAERYRAARAAEWR